MSKTNTKQFIKSVNTAMIIRPLEMLGKPIKDFFWKWINWIFKPVTDNIKEVEKQKQIEARDKANMEWVMRDDRKAFGYETEIDKEIKQAKRKGKNK